MPRTVVVALLSLALVTVASAQDEPIWAFEGVLPMVYEVYDPVPDSLYTEAGHELTWEEIQESFDVRIGDPVVLVRGGEKVGEGEVARVIARARPDARDQQVLYLDITGLPEGVTMPEEPPGKEALVDAGYDLVVVTDKPVEVLAPDPVYEGHRFVTQDYVVRVGRTRYAILREVDPRSDGYRGWMVGKLLPENTVRMMADYTWWKR